METCKRCKGTGKVNMLLGGGKHKAICIDCYGTGKVESVELTEEEIDIGLCEHCASLDEDEITVNSKQWCKDGLVEECGLRKYLERELAKQKAELEPVIKEQGRREMWEKMHTTCDYGLCIYNNYGTPINKNCTYENCPIAKEGK